MMSQKHIERNFCNLPYWTSIYLNSTIKWGKWQGFERWVKLFLDPVWYMPSDDENPLSLLGE